jgi:crossover junction endodeoxyribonuclease RusA
MMQVLLPWPPSALSPNARHGHWASLARARRAYRAACAWQAKAQGVGSLPADARPLVSITFVPPDRRARDRDNMLASIKAGLDGLADVLRCDDSRWRLRIEVAPEVGGFVRVEVLT